MILQLTAYNKIKMYEKTIKIEVLKFNYNYNGNLELSIYSPNPKEELHIILNEFKDFIIDFNYNKSYCFITLKKECEVKKLK